jgi:CDP-glycerol glycerophosphotransferase (TagB/SpsB family)
MSLLKLQLQKQKREIKNNKVITAKIKEKLAYKNIGLYPYFVEGLEYLFEVSYLKNALYYECFNNFLSENEPKLIIILGEGHSHHHLAFYLTKKNGKKVQFLFAMHGSFGDYPLYENLFSDKIALYGRHYGELLVKMKNSPNKMVVTGNPAWDYLATKKINLNNFGDKKIILLAATNMPNERDYLANLVISTLARLPEYQLIIKLHPEEETIYYERLLQKYKIKAEIFTEQLHSLILISSVVITAYSTVGLESLLLNKPVIDVNLTNKPFYQDYVEKGVALGIRKEEDLLPAIKSILEDETVRQKLEKNRKKYIYEHAYKQDGKAAERVVKLINSMLKEVDREN